MASRRSGVRAPYPPLFSDEQNVDKSDTKSPQTRTDSGSPGDTPSLTGDKSPTLSHTNKALFHTKSMQYLELDFPDLAKVVDAWPDLPEEIRHAILTMVKSTAGKPR